ncbi:hypothetical protein BZP36_25990 [Raoultella terrigena]|nr:hypothetical protein BZP36_25990 [Raoultella terrigena]
MVNCRNKKPAPDRREERQLNPLPVIIHAVSLLAGLVHPGHIVIYAAGDLPGYRRDAAGIIQGLTL